MTELGGSKGVGYLATYGTLRRSFPTLHALGVDRYLEAEGPCVIPGSIYDLGGYPGLRLGEGKVIGELYRITDPEALRILDRFEDVDHERPEAGLYRRVAVDLVEPDVTAWVYEYNGDIEGREEVPDGDWVRWIGG